MFLSYEAKMIQAPSLKTLCAHAVLRKISSYGSQLIHYPDEIIQLLAVTAFRESKVIQLSFLQVCHRVSEWRVQWDYEPEKPKVVSLLSQQTHLKSLHLANRIIGFSSHFFERVTFFQQLVELHISYLQDSLISPEGVSLLDLLPNLRVLRLGYEVPKLSMVFKNVMNHPSLQNVEIEVPEEPVFEWVNVCLKVRCLTIKGSFHNGLCSPELEERLAELIKQSQTLEFFELNRIRFRTNPSRLWEALSFLNLKGLRLDNVSCVDHTPVTAIHLLANENIKTFSLSAKKSDTAMTLAAIEPFLKKLADNKHKLTNLNLSGNFLTPDLLFVLFGHLITYQHLTKLNLSRTIKIINDQWFEMTIVVALQKSYSLQVLDLSKNHLGRCVNISSLLKNKVFNARICHLSFADNDLDDQDCLAILEAFRGNERLKSISFEGNHINEKGIESILKAIQAIPNLRTANLSYNGLNNKAREVLKIFAKKTGVDFKIDLS